MKKLSLVVGGFLVLSSSVFAHQISGEFHDASWNWNNGSHFAKMMNNSGDNAVVKMDAYSHTHADGAVHYHDKVVKPADEMMQSNTKEPVFDTGIRPSNSK